jgi:hypothetical protein
VDKELNAKIGKVFNSERIDKEVFKVWVEEIAGDDD